MSLNLDRIMGIFGIFMKGHTIGINLNKFIIFFGNLNQLNFDFWVPLLKYY
jgi:hypothetical protein